MFRTFLLVVTTLSLPYTTAIGQSSSSPELEFSSSPQQTATIELFTSHGCSSCPPADKWLKQYVGHPGLWSEVVPMAFHVDYWDYLGWDDVFADRAYTQRQQNYARSGDIGSVYTPGLVVSGQEWRGFFSRRNLNLETGNPVGVLQLKTDRKKATVSFNSASQDLASRLTAHVAILGFGIESNIGGGENRGKLLEEDFVVLGHNSTRMQVEENEWNLSVPSTVPVQTERLAIVAWVSDDHSPAPLQATGGWLPESG